MSRTSSQEDVIKRLKILSKAQTAFLKSYLHKKLNAGISLVEETVDIIKMDKDPKVVSLRKAILDLKLEEIEVDVESAKVPLQDELNLLRNSLDGDVVGASAGNSASDDATAKKLQREHASLLSSYTSSTGEVVKLKAQVAELNEKIEELSLVTPAPSLSATSNSDAAAGGPPSAEILEEIQALKNKVTILANSEKKSKEKLAVVEENEKDLSNMVLKLEDEEKSMARKVENLEKNEKSLIEKNTELLKEVAQLKEANSSSKGNSSELSKKVSDLLAAQAQAEKDHAVALSTLKAEQAAAMEEFAKSAEAEKEELMDALTLEIEDMEKKNTTDCADLTAKFSKEKDSLMAKFGDTEKKLSFEVKTMQQKYSDAQQQHAKANASQVMLVKGLKMTHAQLKQMKQVQTNVVKQETTKTLVEMKKVAASLFTESVMGKLQESAKLLNAMTVKYKKEQMERKKLHNVIQELKGNIRVYMRCRPPSAKEIQQFGNDSQCVSFTSSEEVRVVNEKGRDKSWEFEQVFSTDSTQQSVYAEVSELVVSALDGYNVCIFAYGQTGSGKTYTMSGPPEDRGVNTRALDELFRRSVERSREYSDVITVTILEVYNEEIRDLLVEGGGAERLEVRRGEFGNFVPGLTVVRVQNLNDVIQLLSVADRYRSHMMLSVTVQTENLTSGNVSRGTLNLVDLAGSERLQKSGAVGQALKEAQNINKSLSALGDVIAARAAKQAHIPFRNSTLTYLLQDSLSQDSKTLMFVCVSPVLYNSEETFCSLNFAARVRSVELGKATKQTGVAGGAMPPAPPGGAGGTRRQSTAGRG